MDGTGIRHRRALGPARAVLKRTWVRFDAVRSSRNPYLREWVAVCVGRSGHQVPPSRSIESSRREALNFVARGMVRPGDRVLDLGSGNGRQAIGLLEAGVHHYAGLDVIKESVDFCTDAFSDHSAIVRFDWLDVHNEMYNPRGSVAPQDLELPYADDSFDFVVAGSLYTHLQELDVFQAYVRETARVLRPGGAAYVSCFRSPPNVATSNAVRSVFDESEVLALLRSHGFVLEAEVGGTTAGWHDQWQLYLRKPAAGPMTAA